jgi:phosphate transport system protein
MRQDVTAAQEVVSEDRSVNRHRWAVEEDALRLIATQGPMAKDLRNIAAAIHIVTDLERMADHAAGIAKIVIDTASEPFAQATGRYPTHGPHSARHVERRHHRLHRAGCRRGTAHRQA